jgi:hypothetical protein
MIVAPKKRSDGPSPKAKGKDGTLEFSGYRPSILNDPNSAKCQPVDCSMLFITKRIVALPFPGVFAHIA